VYSETIIYKLNNNIVKWFFFSVFFLKLIFRMVFFYFYKRVWVNLTKTCPHLNPKEIIKHKITENFFSYLCK